MLTPWGDLPVADSHVHFFSHNFFTLLGAQRGGASVEELGRILSWEMPPADPRELASQWAAELDRHGVATASLIASLPGDHLSVAAAVEAFPNRFHGYFMVNPIADGALGAVEKLAGAGSLCAVCFFPAMHRYSIQDDRVAAICGLLSGRPNTLAFVHCGLLSVGVRQKLGLASPFDMRFSNPIDVHGLAVRFPNLPFVIPHFRAGYFREALMLCDLCANVYLDTSSTNNWIKYITPACSLRDVFRQALGVAGPGRLLFGTDSSFYPRGWHRAVFEEQAALLYDLGVSVDDARAIFGGNLTRLLG